MITMMRGDTRPDLIAYLYERNGCCPIDMSGLNTTVQVKFREKGEDTNIFSVYAQKVLGGAYGHAMLEWPLFGTDVEPGRYELEFNVNYGHKWVTAYPFVQVKIVGTFGDVSYINDSENAIYRGGRVYLRNLDTNMFHRFSMIGEVPSTLEIDQSNSSLEFDPINEDYDNTSTVFLRLIKGQLYMQSTDADNETWRLLSLTGNPVSTLTLSDKVVHFSMGSPEWNEDDIKVKIVDGKFYMKNTDTGLWHEVQLRGTGVSTISIV